MDPPFYFPIPHGLALVPPVRPVRQMGMRTRTLSCMKVSAFNDLETVSHAWIT